VISPLRHAGDGTVESVLVIAHQGTTTDCQGAAIDRQGATADCQGAIADRQGATVDHHGVVTDRQGADAGRQDVLLVEAIDLDVWIFTLAPKWVPTIMVYDNDLELWSS
jgi:hypothetical protein